MLKNDDVDIVGRSSRGGVLIQRLIDLVEDLAGIGALLKLLEDRRRRLAAEGLFAPERKRKLPFLPEVIGIVTSPSGAVIRDVLHRLSDRFPRRVLLWPVAVQGEGAAAQPNEADESGGAAEDDRPPAGGEPDADAGPRPAPRPAGDEVGQDAGQVA